MQLRSESFPPDGPIPGEFGFCVPADQGHVALAPNRNPQLSWSDVPEGTKSFVLICHDPDAPSRGDDVNQDDRTVPAELPRVDFFHWVLIDLPADLREIAAGSHSDAVTPRGKPPGPAPEGVQGSNDYTGWFAGDPDMAGTYAGYDGPCPPWNDSIVHHYHFTLYALDVTSLEASLGSNFTGHQVRDAIAGHVLAEGCVVGTYALNPALRPR